MTSKSDFKQVVRAHMAKTGKSYTAALRDVQGSGDCAPRLAVESLLRQLDAQPFAIQIGRMPAVGASSILAIAQAQAHELAISPKFYAESGSVEMLISKAQLEMLRAAGAAHDEKIQVIRTFHSKHGTTFSEQCKGCDRWIWCGTEEREASCFCGQVYRVVFDLSENLHWTQRQGCRCMACGAEFSMTERHENRNPWEFVNTWQARCNSCRPFSSQKDLTIIVGQDHAAAKLSLGWNPNTLSEDEHDLIFKDLSPLLDRLERLHENEPMTSSLVEFVTAEILQGYEAADWSWKQSVDLQIIGQVLFATG